MLITTPTSGSIPGSRLITQNITRCTMTWSTWASGKATPASQPGWSAPSPTTPWRRSISGRPTSAVAYIQRSREGDKPFFMDVNFIKMHNPNKCGTGVQGQVASRRLFGFLMELDADIGRIMDSNTRRGTRHDRHRDGRQWRLAGCVPRRRDHAVPWREGLAVRRWLARPGNHVVAEPHPGSRAV